MGLANLPAEPDVLGRLTAWGRARPEVRAMILTSTRARPGGPVDQLSDYDIILAVTDAEALAADDAWTQDYGPVLVRWGDQSALYGLTTHFRGVVYQDYVKVDYSLWPVSLLARVAAQPALPDALDVGYRVLLDKEGHTAGWPPPTYRAHIPARPSPEAYRALVEEFWWGATYAAKSLWRGELLFTRFILDYDLKLVTVRRMLEWRVELDHDWSLKPGVYGRGLERLLPAALWGELMAAYAGPAVADNWAALYRLADLFRRVAREVGAALGYEYPQVVDDGVCAFLREVQALTGHE